MLSASSDFVVASSSMFELMHLYWLEYTVLWNCLCFCHHVKVQNMLCLGLLGGANVVLGLMWMHVIDSGTVLEGLRKTTKIVVESTYFVSSDKCNSKEDVYWDLFIAVAVMWLVLCSQHGICWEGRYLTVPCPVSGQCSAHNIVLQLSAKFVEDALDCQHNGFQQRSELLQISIPCPLHDRDKTFSL